jgi:hypothetical protein
MPARNDEQPYVDTEPGLVCVFLPSAKITSEQARQLASDLVIASLEVEHQARDRVTGPDQRWGPFHRRPARKRPDR